MSIIINGAGITGTILALVLSRLTKGDLKISLIKQGAPKYYDSNLTLKMSSLFPPHIVALSQGGYSELMQIDVNALLSSCSGVIKRIEISTWDTLNKVFINAEDYQLSELGYVIELNILKKKLFNLLDTESAVTIHYPATIKKIRRMETNNIVVLDNGCQISAKLMIAADGACSDLATNCGMQWLRKNYQQIAVVAKIITEIPHYGQAFEKFTAFGSLALLPISNQFSFLIWCVSNKKKKEIINWSTNKFSQELQNIFGWTLGKILNVEHRYFYDLWLIQAKSHILHRLAVVGNAAQNLHPIAGQGFNLGLRDIIVLAKIIVNAFYNNRDIGAYSVLHAYQIHRCVDQCAIVNITDGLVRLFNNKDLPLVIARNLGLFFLNYSICLRRLLVNTALYWHTD